MNVIPYSENRADALIKWREYKNAAKVSSNPLYKDLRSVYNQIKAGKKVIDIAKVIPAGGVHVDDPQRRLPKLAIARADQKKIRCEVHTNGNVNFIHSNLTSKYDIRLQQVLPAFQWSSGNQWRIITGEAPVPIIPPKHLPVKLTDDYYTLWEVDEWKMVPPTDPWLLRRLTKTIFVVLAGWDLTEIEKSVMAARL